MTPWYKPAATLAMLQAWIAGDDYPRYAPQAQAAGTLNCARSCATAPSSSSSSADRLCISFMMFSECAFMRSSSSGGSWPRDSAEARRVVDVVRARRRENAVGDLVVSAGASMFDARAPARKSKESLGSNEPGL